MPISPRCLVIHWTANTNKGADADNNRDYFEDHPWNKVSAHYIVDDHSVVQCVPENEMAYHVGAEWYAEDALRQLGSYPNGTTIGIEMCVNSDGDFIKTYQNTVALAADILQRHGWGIDRLWKHYDITGKHCPGFFVDDAVARGFGFESAYEGWKKFGQGVAIALQTRKTSMFEDVGDHWARGSIERLTKKGLIKGDDQGNFRPDQPITRAETAVLIERVLNYMEG